MEMDHPGKEDCVPRRGKFLYLRQTLEELSAGDGSFHVHAAYSVPSTVLGIENTTVKSDNKVQTRADILLEGTCSNGLDLISLQPAPPLERGKGLQKPQLQLWWRTARARDPTCWGYYDVSGQYDKEFECNNSESGYLYCCGTCYYRFCCKKRHEKLDQRQCNNYQSPVWVQTPSTKVVSPGPENKYDPEKDKTNFTVYITCGVIAFVIVAGVFAKVSYDKAHRPPREMNIHRALADILRQQGPIPIAHCERETISAIDTSPKESTPVRSSSKNHYTPVRTAKPPPDVNTPLMKSKVNESNIYGAALSLPSRGYALYG
ncbi:Protein shisa-6 like protein [Myotis brandtii]|uniref:Protein shisa-6 like protein n=1 Tax=Myotis brandtii TaxID=109478 RepID=S7PY04_MYOBR|nr:Protein shisa-6 like protein [Myotis brandtii]